MNTITIKHRYKGVDIYIHTQEENNVKVTFEKAVKEGVDLSFVDMEGVNLVGVNLAGANLRGANFKGANLRAANFKGANLRAVNLRAAILEGANLRAANLRAANLEAVNLKSANLKSANFRGTNLEGANFKGANLRCANLQDANLQGIKHDLAVPKIKNLHQKIADNVTKSNLEMSYWYSTDCGTTHSHAGHIIHLAGEEGYALEQSTSTPLAAILIVNNSSEIEIPVDMFYIDNKAALLNIKELARKEAEL